MTKWDEFLAIRDQCLSTISHNSLHEKYCLLLCIRVLELCQDAHELLSLNRAAAVPVILRSAVESYIDLQLTIQSEDHIEFMNSSLNERMSRIFKDSDEQKYQEFKSRITITDTWKRKIKHKFYDAGKKSLYQGFYAHLCRHAHGNLEALLQDHTHNNKIILGRPPEEKLARFYEFQIVGIAVQSLKDVLTLFSVDEQIHKKLNMLQG